MVGGFCPATEKKSSRNQTFATLDQAVGAAQLGYGIAVGGIWC
ncbi:hypothetical protein QW180_25050 [Vibrio sinaloensis]|nr:hypothetical protein [Vibrio sinaloensis]